MRKFFSLSISIVCGLLILCSSTCKNTQVSNESLRFGDIRINGIVQNRLKQLYDGTYLLDLNNSGITNLNVVTNLPIKHLNIYSTDVTDLTPLGGMNLTSICFNLHNIRHGIDVLFDRNPLELIVYDNLLGYGNIYVIGDTIAEMKVGFIFEQELNSKGLYSDDLDYHLVTNGDTLRSISFQYFGDSNKNEHVRNGRGEKYIADPKVGEIIVMRMIPSNVHYDMSSYEQILSSNLIAPP